MRRRGQAAKVMARVAKWLMQHLPGPDPAAEIARTEIASHGT
jgi:hypothetical protein